MPCHLCNNLANKCVGRCHEHICGVCSIGGYCHACLLDEIRTLVATSRNTSLRIAIMSFVASAYTVMYNGSLPVPPRVYVGIREIFNQMAVKIEQAETDIAPAPVLVDTSSPSHVDTPSPEPAPSIVIIDTPTPTPAPTPASTPELTCGPIIDATVPIIDDDLMLLAKRVKTDAQPSTDEPVVPLVSDTVTVDASANTNVDTNTEIGANEAVDTNADERADEPAELMSAIINPYKVPNTLKLTDITYDFAADNIKAVYMFLPSGNLYTKNIPMFLAIMRIYPGFGYSGEESKIAKQITNIDKIPKGWHVDAEHRDGDQNIAIMRSPTNRLFKIYL